MVRPEQKVPDTSSYIDRSQIDAEVAHESTLRAFAIDHTELSVLDKDQMGVISLIRAMNSCGLQLHGTDVFFENIRVLSPADEGKGRVQAKECITAGAFPMSLLFPQKETGILETIKSFVLRKPASDTQPQKGM